MKGELKKRLTQLGKYDLLIIDELGYLPMNRQSRYNLFQLINSLYEYRSIILTTNKNLARSPAPLHNDAPPVPLLHSIIHHPHPPPPPPPPSPLPPPLTAPHHYPPSQLTPP